jgi:hypothetical protein
MLRAALILGCACWPALAVAQPARLGDGEIREMISGATISLDAPLGAKIPIRYGADGRVSGEARGLAFHLGSRTDTGTWWIASGELCHRWSRWFERKVQCLTLTRDGRTIHWRNQDGRTGTASVAEAAPVQIAAAEPAPLQEPAPTRPEGAMRLSAPQLLQQQPAPPPAPATADATSAMTAPWTTIALKARRPPPSNAAPTIVAQAPPSPPARPPQQPDVRPQQELTAPLFFVANVERGDVLNVRAGPSADHDTVSTLEPGSGGITISGACRAEWCPITLAATSGWVNRRFLKAHDGSPVSQGQTDAVLDSPQAPRGCLTPAARALLDRIEVRFGPVRLVSTCRQGATIAGTGRPSRHASGNAMDFDAGSRKGAIIEWLIANHLDGGTMTYPRMDHIHVDIGPRFVALAGSRRWASWRDGR